MEVVLSRFIARKMVRSGWIWGYILKEEPEGFADSLEGRCD